MKIKPTKTLVIIILAILSAIVSILPITPTKKIFIVMFLGTSTTFLALLELKSFFIWIIDGLKMQGEAIISLAETCKDLAQTVVYDPTLVKELEEKRQKNINQSPSKSITSTPYKIETIEDKLNLMNDKVSKLERDTPNRIAKLSIFITIGIGVIAIIATLIIALIIKAILKI